VRLGGIRSPIAKMEMEITRMKVAGSMTPGLAQGSTRIMAKHQHSRRALSGLGDIQHIDRIMTTLAPLIRLFVEEVVMLKPWERARRIAKLVSALSDIPSGEVH
jgi:hypothetical protein